MVAGAIAAIANFLQFSLFFGGDDNDNPLGIIGTIATIILAPLAATIIQLAVSRQREFVADATGAELLGDPIPLADALETLHRGAETIPMKVNPAAEPLYIVNPLASHAARRRRRLRQAVLDPPAHGGARRAPAPDGRGAAAPCDPDLLMGDPARRSASSSTPSRRSTSGSSSTWCASSGPGASLQAVLEDPYVINRSSTIDRRALLEEPEVVDAAGDDLARADARGSSRRRWRPGQDPGRAPERRYNRLRTGGPISVGRRGGRGPSPARPVRGTVRRVCARVLRSERDHHPVRAGAGLLLARLRRVAAATPRDAADADLVADLARGVRVRRGARRLGLRLRPDPGRRSSDDGVIDGPRDPARVDPGGRVPVPRAVRAAPLDAPAGRGAAA